MPTNYTTEGYLLLQGVTYSGTEGQPGSTLSWTGTNAEPGSDANIMITDSDDDRALDAGVDYAASAPSLTFTGYTISSGGVEYPIFTSFNGPAVLISQDGPSQTLIPTSGTSNAYQAEANTYLCFAEGTEIAGPDGARRVEELRIGDLVRTADGEDVPVLWIGQQTLSKRFTPAERFQPVRVKAGALGNGLPHADLVLTADHALIIDGLAINAGALVNGGGIDWVPMADLPDRVTYYHVETENHAVIHANGAAAETFIDDDGRRAFDNYAEYLELYSEDRAMAEMPLPRVTSARLVPPAICARLAGAAAA